MFFFLRENSTFQIVHFLVLTLKIALFSVNDDIHKRVKRTIRAQIPFTRKAGFSLCVNPQSSSTAPDSNIGCRWKGGKTQALSQVCERNVYIPWHSAYDFVCTLTQVQATFTEQGVKWP